MTEKACRECGRITEQDECPVCRNNDLADSWGGTVLVMNPEDSEIAERLGVNTPGTYAVRTR